MLASPSVTIPKVPSAPINSLVVSKPAADFLARLRVLMTWPFGRTTVCRAMSAVHWHLGDENDQPSSKTTLP